jgi:hypothetical protein
MARERAVSLMNRRQFVLYAYRFPSKSDRYLGLRVDVRQATLAFPSARAFVAIYGLEMSCQISWQDTAVAQGEAFLDTCYMSSVVVLLSRHMPRANKKSVDRIQQPSS